MGVNQSIFSTYLQRSLPQAPHSTGMPLDASVHKTAQPLIKTTSKETCLPAANYYHAFADLSLFLRNVPNALGLIINKSLNIGGNTVVGFTSVLYSIIGLAWAYDNYKQMKACEKIGDAAGAKLARVQIAESISLSMASTALAVVRAFGAVQEISGLSSSPIVLSSAAMAVQTAAAWTSTAFYILYYGIFTWRQVNVLKGLSDGTPLREELRTHANPLDLLKEKIDESMYATAAFSPEKLTDLALEEGANWLEKLEKENLPHAWKPTLESRQEHARQLFLDHPEYMMSEMGETEGFNQLSPEGKIIRFGRFIAAKRLCTHLENELVRLLGPGAVEAANKNDPVAFEKALKSADWSQWGVRWKTVFKICAALTGLSAIVAGTILTGGLALGIPLLVLGVIGIIWIALGDGSLLKSQWESGEIRKRDKFLIFFSMALSVAAMASLITMTVISGGLPLYIAGIVFTAAWLIINGRAVVGLINSQRHPWDFQKEPTIKAFRQLVKTNPSSEKIKEIQEKMSAFNQNGLNELKKTHIWKEAARILEEQVEEIKATSFRNLREHLTLASERVEVIDPNLVAF